VIPSRQGEQVVADLQANRVRRERAMVELEQARAELARLLVVGRRKGLTIAEMARAAAVSRETAHKLLRTRTQTKPRRGERTSHAS